MERARHFLKIGRGDHRVVIDVEIVVLTVLVFVFVVFDVVVVTAVRIVVVLVVDFLVMAFLVVDFLVVDFVVVTMVRARVSPRACAIVRSVAFFMRTVNFLKIGRSGCLRRVIRSLPPSWGLVVDGVVLAVVHPRRCPRACAAARSVARWMCLRDVRPSCVRPRGHLDFFFSRTRLKRTPKRPSLLGRKASTRKISSKTFQI